jgi:hypothetical protein
LKNVADGQQRMLHAYKYTIIAIVYIYRLHAQCCQKHTKSLARFFYGFLPQVAFILVDLTPPPSKKKRRKEKYLNELATLDKGTVEYLRK